MNSRRILVIRKGSRGDVHGRSVGLPRQERSRRRLRLSIAWRRGRLDGQAIDLLKFLKPANDFETLATLPNDELLLAFCERHVGAVMRMSKKQAGGPAA